MTRLRARAALFLRWTADRLSREDPVAQLTKRVTALSAQITIPRRSAEDIAARARHPSAAGYVHGVPLTGVHACACANPDAVDHLPPGGSW